MTTLSEGGRITEREVDEEIQRLRAQWDGGPPVRDDLERLLTPETLAELDLFDRLQLEAVVQVCRSEPNLSAAGRRLFAASRLRKRTANDADRLRKYLAKFELAWDQLNPPR